LIRPDEVQAFVETIPSGNTSEGNSTNGGKWSALGGLQWSSATSIWNEKTQQQVPSSGSKAVPRASPTPPPVSKNDDNNSSYEREMSSPPGIPGKLPVPVPPHPQYRQHRSLSFSVGQHDTDLFGYAPTSASRRDSEGGLRFAYRHSLPVMEEETDDMSQFISGHHDLSQDDINDYRRDSEQYSESGSIWNNNQGSQSDGPILHHRRSVPGTSDYGMWDSLNASRQPAPSSSYLAVMAGLPSDRERLEKMRQRRFSLSQVPTYGNEYQYINDNQDLRMLNHR
jgi:hypothetical protein